MPLSGVTVPIELVIPVVLGLVTALGWLSRRYDRANERALGLRVGRREAAILLRESLREHEPNLEPLSFDDDSAVLEVEYNKDKTRIRNRSRSPLPPRLSPEQEELVRRFALTDDPIRPYRKKAPSRGGE